MNLTPLVALLAWLVLISLFTFAAYWMDKARARRGEWRIPESKLLLLGFLGGTLGAIAAMRCFRHKTSKPTFLWKFTGVTALQLMAVAGLLHFGFKPHNWYPITDHQTPVSQSNSRADDVIVIGVRDFKGGGPAPPKPHGRDQASPPPVWK